MLYFNYINLIKGHLMKALIPEELRNQSILVVDDMSFYVSFISQFLINHGFIGEILTAKKLSEAFDLINNQYKNGKTIGLMITDLHLPDGQGTTLVKKIRENKSLANIPIVLVTTEQNTQKVIESFEAGVDNYVFKPIEDSMMLEKINFAWNKYNKKK
jgi:two-component system chemotaxis response regulator CheY